MEPGAGRGLGSAMFPRLPLVLHLAPQIKQTEKRE